ncbi:hypothetical protein P152DRAFT_507620 [Eremomyces bilateralis CBS 781.70]|uniref:NACHT domain-containing protein n=1 Tax=Eremomyces bilateralis CBS 781.70 TaxID=1392243 RepID=A0A6G1G312_9PEZI|nr:uncharacterized protein P152DRAFT_507620 [Eremomyces bilateralis CBS 781.70]KAF1812310.1 hypothetical protein P152DRAFT_507620 [Eremomyces bilateralis CBS 781.70]
MRLLQCNETGDISLTKDLVGDDPIPSYAILSHTWGLDTEEVTFEDMTNGTSEKKAGYEKIRFCGEQAREDGLQYFWIDTCCINKKNYAELSHAIGSMFRWYPWFTRGWTLQELLAPASVEFFSRERKRLGDKSSLQQQIHEITGVSKSSLRGDPLSQFSVNERMSRINSRQTKLDEDKAYSLLGIFGVYIPPRYGEGMTSAFKRLEDEINKLEKCTRDLRLTDPRDDKKRIEESKGGLLEGSYRWILENRDFQQWRYSQQNWLLWIKGDPGKGKTMLLCADSDLLSYFFCQATDSSINNATAVMRGLIYLLVDQQPYLILHVRRKYDEAGKTLFEDSNAWTKIWTTPFLIFDALDECIEGLPKLLDFIVRMSSVSSRVKWIISSRNWPNIEQDLDAATQKVRLSLELNESSVSAAVTSYIQFKVDRLAERNRYSSNTRGIVQRYLLQNAHGTFLWVALVCQELSKTSGWKAQQKLIAFPPGLDALYSRMMEQIEDSEDAELCKRILAVVSAVYRPLTLCELESLVDIPSGAFEALSEIIGLCGSFLTLRERTISFVHQSASDFLVEKTYNEIFPSGIEYIHHTIFSRSLQVMSKTLRRDIFGLSAPGFPIDQVKQPSPDPLSQARYSCAYWVNHLLHCDPSTCATDDLQDGGSVDQFLRQSYLYWLEALSLCRSISEGVVSMAKLEALSQARADVSGLLNLVKDARRFIMSYNLAIENSPLQAYASALLFSPVCSLIRGLFRHEELEWITIQPSMPAEWNACLQTLEGHSGYVFSVAFSHDSARLASASYDRTVKIWDTSSGACLQTLEGHSSHVNLVAFSPDSARLASASDDRTVKIWDTTIGACLQTLEKGLGLSVNKWCGNLLWRTFGNLQDR